MKSLVGGLEYVWGNQTVLMLLAIACLLNMFAAPYRYSFMPSFPATSSTRVPTGYGMLTAMAGFGALVAGIWVVSLGNFQRKGRLLVWSGIAWPASLLLFALSTSYYRVARARVRGRAHAGDRVDGDRHPDTGQHGTAHARPRDGTAHRRRGALPVGNLLAGAVAERFGAPLAQGAYAPCAMLLMVVIVLLVPSLHRLE